MCYPLLAHFTIIFFIYPIFYTFLRFISYLICANRVFQIYHLIITTIPLCSTILNIKFHNLLQSTIISLHNSIIKFITLYLMMIVRIQILILDLYKMIQIASIHSIRASQIIVIIQFKIPKMMKYIHNQIKKKSFRIKQIPLNPTKILTHKSFRFWHSNKVYQIIYRNKFLRTKIINSLNHKYKLLLKIKNLMCIMNLRMENYTRNKNLSNLNNYFLRILEYNTKPQNVSFDDNHTKIYFFYHYYSVLIINSINNFTNQLIIIIIMIRKLHLIILMCQFFMCQYCQNLQIIYRMMIIIISQVYVCSFVQIID